jgi:hypothetical protein
MLVVVSFSLQFLRATTLVGLYSESSGIAYGPDFTVYRAIKVTAIGIFDGDAPGFNSTWTARILDHSTDRVIVDPIYVNMSDARADDSNPFAFKNVSMVLPPGVYTLLAVTPSPKDKWLTTNLGPNCVVVGDTGDGAILATNGAAGGNGLSVSGTKSGIKPSEFVVGATFQFEVVVGPGPVVSAPTTDFVDCEAVACAGLTSGYYNIQGWEHYCDNDAAGGGWLRLWRADETSCEANGWTSMAQRWSRRP